MKFNPKLVSLECVECGKVYELFTVAYLPSLAWGWVSNTLREWETVKPNVYPLGLKPRWPPVTVGARHRQCYGRIGNCEQSKRFIGSRSSSVVICTGIRSGTCAVKPCFMDTRLIRTPRYITDSLLCPWGKKAPTFSLNSTHLIRTPNMASSVSVLTGFDCTGSI